MNPEASLTDVLDRENEHPASQIEELRPERWRQPWINPGRGAEEGRARREKRLNGSVFGGDVSLKASFAVRLLLVDCTPWFCAIPWADHLTFVQWSVR